MSTGCWGRKKKAVGKEGIEDMKMEVERPKREVYDKRKKRKDVWLLLFPAVSWRKAVSG